MEKFSKYCIVKRITFLSCLMAFSLSGWAQTHGRPIVLTEVGWTFILPQGFDILDSSGIAASLRRGKKIVDASDYKKLDTVGKRVLISAKKKNNSFVSGVIPFDEIKDGKWENSIQIVRDIYYQTISKNLPSLQFDSSTNLEVIDSLKFNKFFVEGKENGTTIITAVILSKLYRGYDFSVMYVVADNSVRKEIEQMLRKSKFLRE